MAWGTAALLAIIGSTTYLGIQEALLLHQRIPIFPLSSDLHAVRR